MCDLRRKLNKNINEDESAYKEINSKIKRDINKAKEDWINRKCNEIDNYFTHNNIKKHIKSLKI